ncbi:gliding motility-associated C-terminal domain-containing protein [bacterium]|nr:gliding motility-associated C-terminal domain-containing protein [bacterium]
MDNLNYYPPGQPYSLNSNSITSNSFCASWTQGASGPTQPPPTSYKYWVTNAGGGPVVGVTNVGGTSACVYGLAPNTSYNFNVVGVNSIGDGYTSTKIITTDNQFPQTITFNPDPLPDKIYGDADFSVSATAPGGTVTFSSSNTTIATVSGTTVHIVKAGTVNIYADQAGSTNYYAAPRVTRSLTINPKALTVDISGVTTSNKVYDGNTSTAYTGALPVGIVGSDVVTLVQSGTFADKNVADGISIVPAMSLTGTNAANYTLTQPVLAVSANITPKELTVSGATAQNKIYDTNTNAVISGATLVGKVGADDVTLATATAGTFADANVANGINVIPAMTITGAAAGNYTLTQPTLSANITQKELTVSGALAQNKIYDSTTSAEITGATLVGVLNSEDVVLATETAGTFAVATVANTINVVPAMTITGAGIANYSLTQPTLSANITQKELSVTGEVADNKVYDSNTNATYTGASLVGVFPSDMANVTLLPVGLFADANIATGITVTPILSISGVRSTNYLLTQPANTVANITAKELTVSGAVASNKIYDGNTAAIISGATLLGVVGSEDVVLGTKTAGTFVSSEVANGIGVTPVMTISGTATGNYTLTQPTLSANITPKELTVTGAIANNKIYDSTTGATFSGATLVGIVGTDDVVLHPAGTFATKNKGTGISVTPVMTISGAKAGDYSITQPVLGATANITAKELTVSGAIAANKVYDTNTDAEISGASLVGVIGSEDVLLSTATAGIFADLNVANNISVATAMTIIGSEISNYTLTQPVLSANITKAPLMITLIIASSKDYDGSTFATLTGGTLTGVLGSDVVTITPGSADFSDKNVGNGKAVTASGYRLAGSEAHNYLLSVQPLVSSADIYSAPLTITGVTAANKVYDANTTAVLSGGSLVGIQGSDNVTITLGTGTFTDKTIGTGKTVTAAGYGLNGSEASNYNLTAQPDGIKADIIVAPLSISGVTAASKVYDGTTVASLSGGSLVGVQASDNVSITAGTGSFADKNTGTGKVVAANGYALAGTDAGNYSLIAQPGDLSANITVAQLNVTAENKTKTYGSQNPQLTLTYSGFLNGDNIQNITAPSITCLATVASKAGDYDITLSGGSASNYNLAFTKGNLQITKAALKVTAENKTRLFGSANPEFTFTYEGFVNNEAAAALATQPIASTTANTTSIPGDYQIIVSGGSSDNYSLSYNNGNLMVKALAGDTNGDGKIVSPEIVGDTNGDGKITPPEIAGDRNGDGTIGDDEKTGDKDGNGKIGDGETTGDKDGDGKVDNGGIAGDINGDGKITPPEIAGDTNGDGKITPPEVTGDTNGDGKIDGKEIAGDSTGTGTIKPGGIAGDTNGDGKITPPEVAGDTNGDGKITPPEVAGDTNGDGKIGAGETTGDKDGDGKVDVGGIAGDINGDGKITPPEIAGDTNGDGKINGSEIAGDKDGNGKIDGNEIAGDTNGDGVISATEIVGDVNGDGKINSDEVAGDKNGDKQIGSSETRVINPAKDHINVNHLFSPNGDGYNDYWIIPEIEKYGRIYLKIYDRWGSIVFESTNYQNDWDGTSKGKLVPEGAYFFFIKSDKLSDKTGAINIIR